MREEILHFRQDALLAERAQVAAERSRLENERELHIRELRRLRDEVVPSTGKRNDSDNLSCTPQMMSRFSVGTILNRRYMLMRLLGRGGFSEVFRAYDLAEQSDVALKIHQLNTAVRCAVQRARTRLSIG